MSFLQTHLKSAEHSKLSVSLHNFFCCKLQNWPYFESSIIDSLVNDEAVDDVATDVVLLFGLAEIIFFSDD